MSGEVNPLIPITNDWQPIIEEATQTPSYKKLQEFLIDEYTHYRVFPTMENIWTAFQWTPYHQVKVVILGQDPYHGEGQAHGLSFSVQPEVQIPPSLRNIFQELKNDLDITPPNHGYLKSWADQGVLLLNSVLTVRAHQANSHRSKGWEHLTDDVIRSLNNLDHPVVFILWGRAAQNKKVLIDLNKHYIIESSHPSPLSAHRGFIGSRPFSRTNQILTQNGLDAIDWRIPNL